MAGNTFGKIFQLHSFGESHGHAMGGIIDGFPSDFQLDIEKIRQEVQRRKTNQGIHSSSRSETDHVLILSGIFQGKTLGTPIAFSIENKDSRSEDYEEIKNVYRPSHADYTWESKFGHRDYRGGGRSSARETISRVVAGALAKQFLHNEGIRIIAWVKQIGDISWEPSQTPTLADIEKSQLRCPDENAEKLMQKQIEKMAAIGDTLGGIIHCHIEGVPKGLGEPVFDKLNAVLAHAMMSINAVKGVEFGSGFAAAAMKGSEHNDAFILSDGKLTTQTNHSGGIQGGISNGEPISINVAFKPVASIQQSQNSINNKMEGVEIAIKGRHDVCVVPRAVPIVEAMAAMVLMDFILISRTNKA
jgi:chorismate synthase